IIEAKNNVKIVDDKKNIYRLKQLKYFVKEELIEGSGLISNNADGSYMETRNFKIDIKNKKSSFFKNKYTTCNKIKNLNDEYCPSWSISSNETKHDQNKKEIVHKSALLKLKNIPVLYMPYFYHPDPSVKRKSGFLQPKFQSISNSGKTLATPYFFALSEDKNFILTPVIYTNEKSMLKANYIQKFKNSSLEIDTSYWGGYSNFDNNKLKGSKNHFFLDFQNENDDLLLKKNKINFKLQRVSQENYLKINKINSNLFEQDINNLENKIELISFDETKKLSVAAKIFEKLNIHSNEKYEYVFPNLNFSKNFYNKNGNNFNLTSIVEGKQLNVNEKQLKSVNSLNYNTNPTIYKSIGLTQNLKTSFKNINYNFETSNKNVSNINNYFTIGVDNSIPFYKKNSNITESLVPRFFAKYTSGSEKYLGDQDKEIGYFDLFSMDRSNDMLKPETGLNAGLGIDWERNNLDSNKSIYLKNKFGIGQIFNSKKNNMPTKSTLDQKSSDFVGLYSFNLLGKKNETIELESDKKIKYLERFKQNNLGLYYKFSIDRDLNSINKNNLELSTVYKNFNAGITFSDKKNIFDKEKYYSLETINKINNNLYISLNNKKNLVTNNTEKLSLGVIFENDCIAYNFSYNKEFYQNNDLNNNNSLTFSFVIKPFGDSLAPDLSEFVK
ncbi:MAG: hypothetical protein VW907_06380, partial [Opitutae bacterium]